MIIEKYLTIIYNAHLIDYYQFWIYNRWGENIFNTSDMYQGWDSSNFPIGVYSWRVLYVDIDGNKKSSTGQLTLLR